jgi:hypothetical protein
MTERAGHAFDILDEGRRARFTAAACGPWSPRHCHGGAVSALIAHLADAVPAPAPMQLARLTLELHRPVPTDEVAVETAIVREGRKLQLLDIRLAAEGAEVARAAVLRLRKAEAAIPPETPQPAFGVAGPDAGAGFAISAAMGFGALFELRSVSGAFREPGPASVWFRLKDAELAGGRPPLGAALAAAVSDFSNGVSSVLPFEAWTYVNADLTVSLTREPEGEWVLLDAETLLGDQGRALARARLADHRGWLGSATQSVLLERR